MKIEIKDVSPTMKELHLEVPAEAIKPVYIRVSQKIARSVNIPGFRKGFAPVDIVKIRFAEKIKSEVLRELVPQVVSQAFKEKDLNPLGEPQINVDGVETVNFNGTQPVSLRVYFEVMPEIEAPKYKGLKVTRRVRPVSDEDLERTINERLRHSATLMPVEDRKSQQGDTLIVDLEGIFVDKPEEDPIIVEALELTLGDENIETAFTDNLVGLEQDDEKEFTVEYPKDFSSQFLAGQKVAYKAKVKSVGKIEVPEADDDWAQGLEEEYKSMKDLRKKLRDDHELWAKIEADNKVRDELVTQLIDAHPIEVPRTLTQIQARTLLENFAQNLAKQGMELSKMGDEFIKPVYQQMLGQAERDVRGALLLNKIAEIENIEVTSEEIAAEIEKMSEYYQVTPEKIRTSLSEQGGENSIADRLRSRKSVEVLVAKAKITEGEWIEEKAAASKGAASAESSVAETGPSVDTEPPKKKSRKKKDK